MQRKAPNGIKMKKLIAAAIVMLLLSISTMAQTKAYDVIKDPKEGGWIFDGLISFADLNTEPTFNWMKSGSDAYMPEEKYVATLRKSLKDYTIVAFLGTWCDDSHNLIPKLEKVLTTSGFPPNQLTMYGIDRDKKSKTGEERKYEIKFAPTIILLKNGKEAGRITETVLKSVEADMAAIVEGGK